MRDASGRFEGWYFKLQSAGDTVALIPGIAGDGAFIQVVTDGGSYHAAYDAALYHRDGAGLLIAGSSFSPRRAALAIRGAGLSIAGEVRFRHRTPLTGDVMGPLRFLPMQCRHRILSLHHELAGALTINGRRIDFTGGVGYTEGDSGRAFPERYVWIQSNDFAEKCCVALAIADVPLLGRALRGMFCVIWYRGVEYRLATYNGARVVVCTRRHIVLRRGKLRLEVKLGDPPASHPLRAPDGLGMNRVIHEAPACPARFRFFAGGSAPLFDMESPRTSCEFVGGMER